MDIGSDKQKYIAHSDDITFISDEAFNEKVTKMLMLSKFTWVIGIN